MKKKLINYFIIFLFMTVLLLPIVQMIFPIFPEFKTGDNRALSKRPTLEKINISKIKKFIDNYDTYFNDHFGFRATLIKANCLISYHILKTSPLSYVDIGKNGWLFYDTPFFDTKGVDISFHDFFGTYLFKQPEVELIKKNLSQLKTQLDARNIRFQVVLCPDKCSVYPEYLSDTIAERKGTRTRADQIAAIMSDLHINYLDLRPILLKEKNKSPYILYYKTDTHWNMMAGFIAYQSIIKSLNDSRLTPHEFTDYILSKEEGPMISTEMTSCGGDIARMINMSGEIPDMRVNLKLKTQTLAVKKASPYAKNSLVMENPNQNLPKILAFRDSFFMEVFPFLSEHFSRSVYIWQPYVDLTIVDKEKPDVVILEFVERSSGMLQFVSSLNKQ